MSRIDETKVELITKMGVPIVYDEYTESVCELLVIPKWYHPFKRRAFFKTYNYRLSVIMAVYAQDLLSAINEK